MRQQLKWGSPYSPSDNEPKLLVMDSFAPHKNTGTKAVAGISQASIAKFMAEQKMREDLKEELRIQNITSSIIPGGGTGFVQPLDICFNKLIKGLIREQEEEHWDKHQEEWKAGKFTRPKQRVLLISWVGNAWLKMHEIHKELIIKTFRQTGLSLNPDGSEDHELKIRDLPGIDIGDWTRQDTPDPIIILGKTPRF